jgi:hypothetical protein
MVLHAERSSNKETEMLPIAAEIATRLTREDARSARPHAPVRPLDDTGPRTTFVSRLADVARRFDH